MKFLGRFENQARHQARQAAEAQLQVVREEYGRYCKSYFMSTEQALLDFEELIRHPMVQCVDFANINSYRYFLIGTKHVTITDSNGVRFNIGEFIIMIHRPEKYAEKKAPVVMVENVTPPNAITGGVRRQLWQGQDGEDAVSHHPHPHVSGNPGTFCMSTGGNELNLAITQGEMLEAFLIIISALQSAGPGTAYHDLDNWPLA